MHSCLMKEFFFFTDPKLLKGTVDIFTVNEWLYLSDCNTTAFPTFKKTHEALMGVLTVMRNF